MSKLLSPVHGSLDRHRAGFSLLKKILALPGCPWQHRLATYGQPQIKLIQEAMERLTSILEGTHHIQGILVVLDEAGVLEIASKAIEHGDAAKVKSVNCFIYDSYNNYSMLLKYYKSMYCEDLAIAKVLKQFNMYSESAVANAFELKTWYIAHREALNQLNIGIWELEGLTSWENFITLIVKTARNVSTVPHAALRPGSYGMSLVDKELRKQDIRLIFKDSEYADAVNTARAVEKEKHKTRYKPACPIEMLGDIEAEMAWKKGVRGCANSLVS